MRKNWRKSPACWCTTAAPGKVPTIGLMGNYAVRETIDRARYSLARAKDVGLAEPTVRAEGGSEHVPLDAASVPGFWRVQEGVEDDQEDHAETDKQGRVRREARTARAQSEV